MIADLLADFANATYRKDGTNYASFTAMGGVFIGSPTVNASGLTCTGTQRARITYGFDTDAIWVVDFDAPTAGATRAIFEHYISTPDRETVLYRQADTTYRAQGRGGSLVTLDNATSAPKWAGGFQAGSFRASFNGGAIMSGVTTRPNLTGAELYVGGDAFGGSNATLQPIRSIAIYKGSFTDAQIQSLSA